MTGFWCSAMRGKQAVQAQVAPWRPQAEHQSSRVLAWQVARFTLPA